MLQNPQLHYLDNAATTIVAPEVADVINKAMREHWANPSSLYGPGARSEEALNAARAAVARTLGCKSRELYFTSCGSESNNLALLGAVQTRTFGKGKWVLKAEAFDLLHQLSNTTYAVNAQGRTEVWRNTIPSYAMLHLAYKWSKMPKGKK